MAGVGAGAFAGGGLLTGGAFNRLPVRAMTDSDGLTGVGVGFSTAGGGDAAFARPVYPGCRWASLSSTTAGFSTAGAASGGAVGVGGGIGVLLLFSLNEPLEERPPVGVAGAGAGAIAAAFFFLKLSLCSFLKS